MNPGRELHRRQRILAAAARLLSHYGVAKTTVADIAREAQVGVGTVYLEFDSKEDILEALSRSGYDDVLEAMRQVALCHAPMPERLTQVVLVRSRGFLRHAQAGTHSHELLHCYCPSVERAYHHFLSAERQLLAQLLEEGRVGGELATLDPERAATAIQYALWAFTPPWVFKHNGQDVEEVLSSLTEVLLRGLLRRP